VLWILLFAYPSATDFVVVSWPFSFIRASVKDRTQEVKLVIEQAEASALMPELQQQHLPTAPTEKPGDARAEPCYVWKAVRPLFFLAIFLTPVLLLGLVWLYCFFPNQSGFFRVGATACWCFFTGKERALKWLPKVEETKEKPQLKPNYCDRSS